ncbi:hypothetical protein AB205_0182160 [Aquarana catesbeiana]|uniref:G-protein coupled receptors family 1 profile domain-containing protein n=1 Tax=Aquarana catesbeiana TaxID=8400 RepID=A0A2G9S7Q5_AQUCT|nr:hypothetical protein AB205_0182160 [Aquarana catesbeiana]
MCELLAFLKLFCDSISSKELQIFCISFISLLLPFVLILVSYICILSSVLKIQSVARSKAFSTCSSHLAAVELYFGTVMLMYFGPSSQYSLDQEKCSPICYVILSPMLNPLIYSLNNREIKTLGMEHKNETFMFQEIILLGFSKDPKINTGLFVLFFMIYIVTVIGNGLMLCIVLLHSQLHIPMYFFLCILSILDLCYSTTVLPKLLGDLFSSHGTIFIGSCIAQIYIILLVEGCECLLLATMAYDRYVAICQPLHYPIVMRWSMCFKLTILIFVTSFILCTLPSLFSPITICYNQINHFMCELLAFLKLSCDSISSSELQIFCISFISLLLPFVLILVSYICILSSVLKIQSAGRSKAFSTCSSHLSVVGLYFGTVMLMYFGPSSQYSTDQEKYSSICYVIVSPMLNPLIYSLNNREIKTLCRTMFKQN